MEHDEAKISPAQLMLLIAGFILGSSLLTSFMDDIAGQDAWVAVLAAFLLSIPFLLSYVRLYKLFPGKNFAQVNDIVYGPYLGKAITALYAAYFFLLLVYNVHDLSDFYISYVIPDSPQLIFLIVLTLTCAYAVKKGIEAIARASLFAVAYYVFAVAVTTLLLLGSIDLTNLLPVFRLPARDLVQSTHIFAAIPFCEVIAFVMIFPSLNDYKKAGKYAVGGLAAAALLLLIIVVRNTGALGLSARIFTDTSYEAARLIDIGDVLTRIELVVAVAITVALFLKIAVLYYATVSGISTLCRVRSPQTLIVPLGIAVVVLASGAFASSVSFHRYGANYHPMLAVPFEFVIPPLSLLIARLRRLPEKRGKRT